LYALFMADRCQGGDRFDRRFAYLSFLTNPLFATDPKLIERVVRKALAEMHFPEPSKAFVQFLKDPQGVRLMAARRSLDALFQDEIRRVLREERGGELARMAQEPLQLPSFAKPGMFLYTLPKMVGVDYFMDALGDVPLVFKVKVMGQEGNGSFVHTASDLTSLDPNSPAIVVELVASDRSAAVEALLAEAAHCPSHSHRRVQSKERHPGDAACLFCRPKTTDVSAVKQRFVSMAETPKEMMMAFGADFMRLYQQPLAAMVAEAARYPELAASYAASVRRAEALGLTAKTPGHMSVFHVYCDCVGRARTNELLMDAPYDAHMARRGLV
ncbi:MAG: hypothetical protein RL235_716, partial [Chlamydiota bacterium]|jgi:hypothetical protein